MSHVRAQLRAVAAARVTGLATTGSRVHQTRMPPQHAGDLPCLLVFAGDETIISGAASGLQDRELQIVIRGMAMANANLDATLDQIALEVETAMAAVGNFTLSRVETDIDDSLEKPAGMISLTYQTLYFTQAGNPGISV